MSYTFDPAEPLQVRQRRRKMLEALMSKGSEYGPIASPWQGAARMAEGAYEGMQIRNLRNQDKADNEADATANSSVVKLLSGGGSEPSVSPAAAALTGGTPNYRDAIASVESGGKYDILGPLTKGDRAYGKYQVMGKNIPSWTKEALGQEMTPEDFLRNPEAQDKVFDHRFGGYVKQYGNPQDAASMWFSGRPMAQAGNAKDVLGTTVPGYVSKFTAALTKGQPQPTQIAQAQSQDVMPGGPTTVTDTVQPGGMMGMGAQRQAWSPQQMQQAQQLLLNPRLRPEVRALLMKQMEQNDPQAVARKAQAERKTELEIQDLQRRASQSNDPTSVQEYNFAKQNGFTGTFAEFKKINTPSTNVTVEGNKIQSEGDKVNEKALAEMYPEIWKDGRSARTELSQVKELRTQLAKLPTGTPEGSIMALFNKVGIKLGPQASALEAVDSLINKLTPAQRQGLPGAASDTDIAMFKAALPSLWNTPGGNKIIMDTMEALAESRVKSGSIAQQVITGKMTRAQGLEEMDKLGDPLAAFKAAQSAAPAPGGSPAPAPAPAPGGAPTAAEIEAEMRRRGIK